jgi:sulfite reductase alpha subunit-like flavoprotein
VLAVFPQQPPAAVDAFLARLGLAGSDMVHVTAQGAPAAAGFTCSLRRLVAGMLDVAGASPRRFLFQVLAQHCGAEMERQRLEYFATAEGRDDLYRWVGAWLAAGGMQGSAAVVK